MIGAALGMWAETKARNCLPIAGNSMLPLIRDGDRVWIEHGADGVRRGDIVVYGLGEALTAHRVLCVCCCDTRTMLFTKGDHALHCDFPIGSDRVIGRVLGVERAGRYLALDTRGWRVGGSGIAAAARFAERLCVWVAALEGVLFGPQATCLSAKARRATQVALGLALKILRPPLGRWTSSRPT
jgi:signal peptidase I